MKQCDLQNQLKEGAPKDLIACTLNSNSEDNNNECLLVDGKSCPCQLPQKTERELLIEEATRLVVDVAWMQPPPAYRAVLIRLIAFIKKEVK